VVPDIVKPVPPSVGWLIVRGKLPVDVKVRACVAAVFTGTLPNAMLVALRLRIRVAGSSCMLKLLETVPADAVSVTACAVPVHQFTRPVNPALVAFADTVMVAGTVTPAVKLLDRFTFIPPLGAGAVSVTVQASSSHPVAEAVLQDTALNATAAWPVEAPATFVATSTNCALKMSRATHQLLSRDASGLLPRCRSGRER
jgi:hypothetical protein